MTLTTILATTVTGFGGHAIALGISGVGSAIEQALQEWELWGFGNNQSETRKNCLRWRWQWSVCH